MIEQLSFNTINIETQILDYLNQQFTEEIVMTTNKSNIVYSINSFKFLWLFQNKKRTWIEYKVDENSINITDDSAIKNGRFKINISNVDCIVPEIKNIINSYEIASYNEIMTFGCCYLYNQCSDEKRCINKDIDWSNGCQYKKNLENNIVIYGKNRNF